MMRWLKRIQQAIAIGKVAKRAVRAAKRLVNDKPKRNTKQDERNEQNTGTDRA